MNKQQTQIGAAFLVLVALLLLTGAAWAAAPADYTLDWWTVDGGGGTWSNVGEQYELNGTIGQPDADIWDGGGYTLAGGFWPGGAAGQYPVYLPLILR
jgi:hypothetical protein